MKCIGIDFGSGYFKAVILDEQNSIIDSCYRKYTGFPLEESEKFIEKIGKFFPDEKFIIGITSLNSIKKIEKSIYVNEIIATASGVKSYYPDAMSVIEIGGETSKFIVLKKETAPWVSDFKVNTHCAAGTGSFIEQQVRRLNITVDELSNLSIKANKAAKIAGRCSVFAKSDMIHLQQKGTPVEEIAYGLCMAIAKNSIATFSSGMEIPTPIVIGGGCAKNRGIIKAFFSLLKFKPEKIIVSQIAGMESAIGAALEAKRTNKKQYSTSEIRMILAEIFKPKNAEDKIILQKITQIDEKSRKEPSEIYYEQKSGYLGIDIGSVSTNIVILNEKGEVLSAVYLPTAGNPIRACRDGLTIIKERFQCGINILGCGTTGSGRYLIAKLVGADLIKNEITCQMLGTTFFFPDADTIFEIGGQDSKFISLENGRISDFVMNKICAAGTGSFIEEQASQLGIDIYKDFAQLAFNSISPPNFSSNCTVFMESELASELKKGIKKDDACAGIAYAIARNYLEKVVRRKKIGEKIVFQGGVASNSAVVSAFRNTLGKEVVVHPYNRISGAIGAAIAVMNAKIEKTEFRGFDIEIESKPRTFECRACSNYCEVTEINIRNEKAFFGDVCEKFTSRGATKFSGDLPNLAEEFLYSCESMFNSKYDSKITVGIPRASFFFAYMPFWWKFFQALDIKPVLSSPTSEKTLLNGSKYLSASTCLPVKSTIGHISELIEKGVDFVFFPSIASLHDRDPGHRAAVCPYTISIPFMSDKFKERVFSPVLSMKEDLNDFFNTFSEFIDFDTYKIKRAFKEAEKYQKYFDDELKKKGKDLLNTTTLSPKFVVLGRPYNVFDSYINMNLFAHLKKLNVLALPYNYIEGIEDKLFRTIVWKFPAEILRVIKFLLQYENVYPVVLSNFGCGVDGITQKMIEEILIDKPYLMLEFDEHRGEAGMITRLEAFLDLIESRNTRKSKSISISINMNNINNALKKSKIFIPYFADHARALSGAFRFAGYNAELLPIPDDETKELGTAFSSGRECHAYAILLGDLLKLTKTHQNEKIYYCFTGTNIPCLLNQFSNSMNLTLDRKLRNNITVIAPVMEEFFNLLNINGCKNMYEGLFAIELLLRLRCRLKPYEIEPGKTEETYEECLKLIEESVAKGNVFEGFKKSLEKFSKIRIQHKFRKPIVGIAGDIYTRINSFANDDLFSYLENSGFEVIPAPFEIDIIDFAIEKNFFTSIKNLNLIKSFPHALLYARKSLMRKKYISTLLKLNVPIDKKYIHEPNYKEAMMLAKPYFKNAANEVILLNIAKINDFIRKGAQGIINAMCLNCMVGTSSQVIIENIKREYKIPMISLVYSTKETQSQRMLLDAFIEQVRNLS